VKLLGPVPVNLPLGKDPSSMSPSAMGVPIMKGGPGTSTPGRIHYANVSLMDLIMKAYGIHLDQVHGPSRLTSDKYAVDAIVPSGATREQFQQMFQNLLLKRFKRDFRTYHLVVAQGGPKLKLSAVGDPGDDEDDPASVLGSHKQPTADSHGCPVLPPTRPGFAASEGGSNCATFVGYSISELVAKLEEYVAAEAGTTFGQSPRAHIIDDTGLSGRFDFNLNYSEMYFLTRASGVPFLSRMSDKVSPSDGRTAR
jgi:uncharacterized protein (TIGR03435 family)